MTLSFESNLSNNTFAYSTSGVHPFSTFSNLHIWLSYRITLIYRILCLSLCWFNFNLGGLRLHSIAKLDQEVTNLYFCLATGTAHILNSFSLFFHFSYEWCKLWINRGSSSGFEQASTRLGTQWRGFALQPICDLYGFTSVLQ